MKLANFFHNCYNRGGVLFVPCLFYFGFFLSSVLSSFLSVFFLSVCLSLFLCLSFFFLSVCLSFFQDLFILCM